MNDNSSSGGATAANDTQLLGAGGDPASAVVIDVTDVAWKEALKAGDLVDAKDSAGMWYQVRRCSYFGGVIYLVDVLTHTLTPCCAPRHASWR
jgi:hypothetical protein